MKVEKCKINDKELLVSYIDEFWQKNHILVKNQDFMFYAKKKFKNKTMNCLKATCTGVYLVDDNQLDEEDTT